MMSCRPRLEMLNLSQNRLDRIQGLKMLGGLIALNLGTYTGTGSGPCDSATGRCLAPLVWILVGNQPAPALALFHFDGVIGRCIDGVRAMDTDNNGLGELGMEAGEGGDSVGNGCLGKLRILRVSGNRLHRLDGECFPNLRTLYADNNALTGISHCGRMRKLENLSLRNQAKGKL